MRGGETERGESLATLQDKHDVMIPEMDNRVRFYQNTIVFPFTVVFSRVLRMST